MYPIEYYRSVLPTHAYVQNSFDTLNYVLNMNMKLGDLKTGEATEILSSKTLQRPSSIQ
jgi:hypothetical protein